MTAAVIITTVIAATAIMVTAREAAADTRAVAPFTFTIPQGWRDVSPGVAAAQLAGIPAPLLARARASGAVLVAFDLAGAADGFIENLNVRITRCVGEFTDAKTKKIAESMAAKYNGARGGPRLRARQAATVMIGGVRCGRMVLDLEQGPLKVRQLSYHLPAGRKCAIATYSAATDSFDRYLPIFEAAARATQGLATPESRSFWSRIGKSAGRGAIIGGIAGGLAVLLLGLFKWLKRRGKT